MTDSLQAIDVYALKISGWVNRLNEIRERLKCSVCKEIMKPNMQYAKNLARYNMTIASCGHGINHDYNIYLNHCWACQKIIDSRDNVVQFERYYLCLDCGSGPQSSEEFSQGDTCPKCGALEMESQSVRIYSCRSHTCGHQINIPPVHKQTGKRKLRTTSSAKSTFNFFSRAYDNSNDDLPF